MPTAETLLVRALWATMLLGSLWGGVSAPPPPFLGELPATTTVVIMIMPIAFFGMMAFILPAQSPFYHPKFANWINQRFGSNAFESFLVRLKPMLLFAVSASIQSLGGIWEVSTHSNSPGMLNFHGFMLSAAAGFVLSHLILYRRKAIGVFPTWLEERVERSQPHRRSLRECLREYWWCLIGLGAFPVVFLVFGERWQLPFDYFILPFFAVGFLAGWPYFSGRAPFSYVLVMGAVWLLGGIVSGILSALMYTGA